MKFKDVLIMAFLAGLLIYAFCYRAGIVGSHPQVLVEASVTAQSLQKIDTLKHDQWIFTAHPDLGLTVSTLSGDTIHQLPEFRSGLAGIDARPDTTGISLGLLVIRSDCGFANPCFRIMSNGTLESVNI